MPAQISAHVNPDVLLWAREQSGYPPDTVAKRLRVAADRVSAWERGDRQPTVRQVQALARYYHRPFGTFFLPQPPVVSPLAAEYRRLPGVQPGIESPEFRLALRVMSRRRAAMLELAEELGLRVLRFEVGGRLSEGTATVGHRLRQAVGIDLEEQLAWRDDWEAWRVWRERVEAAGILVFLFPKVPLAEVRGVSLLTVPLPVVGINSKEHAPGARVFTLVHELVHVALALTNEERVALRETRSDAEWDGVERFAEEAASEAIIPREGLRDELARMGVRGREWDVPRVRQLASRFHVTPLAIATRLRSAGLLGWDKYRRWTQAWNEYVSALKPRSGGLATPVEKALGRGGRPFAQLVLEALDTNHITAVDACQLLDLRFDHFDTLRAELRRREGSRAGTDDSE